MSQEPPKVTKTITERTGHRRGTRWSRGSTYTYKEARYHWTDANGVRHNEYSPPPGSRFSPTREETRRTALIGVAVAVVVIAGIAALVITGFGGTNLSPSSNASYNDGYAWGNANVLGILSKTAAYCSPAEMTSSGPVADPGWVIHKPMGAGEPNDNFAQWSMGCRAGGLQALDAYCAGSTQFCPVVTPTWYRP